MSDTRPGTPIEIGCYRSCSEISYRIPRLSPTPLSLNSCGVVGASFIDRVNADHQFMDGYAWTDEAEILYCYKKYNSNPAVYGLARYPLQTETCLTQNSDCMQVAHVIAP
jgi:hypothetical protein